VQLLLLSTVVEGQGYRFYGALAYRFLYVSHMLCAAAFIYDTGNGIAGCPGCPGYKFLESCNLIPVFRLVRELWLNVLTFYRALVESLR